MPSKSFSYSNVLGFGWRVMLSNYWFFVGVGVVLFLISFSGQVLGQVIEHYPKVIAPFLLFALLGVSSVIEIIVGIGLIKIALIFCDGSKPRFSTLFNGLDCFWRYLGSGILYGLIMVGTPIACFLPFILLSNVMSNPFFGLSVFAVVFVLEVILLLKFSLCFYFVVDRGLGPINALKASSMATTDAKGALFVFGILCGLINILGALCFIIGLTATVPMIMVAMALVYRNLSEQTPELAELGISGPYVKPSTGGGVGASAVGVQSSPIIPPMQPSPSVQLGLGVKLAQDVQPSEDVQFVSQGVQPGVNVQPAPIIRRQGEKGNKSLIFWVILLVILSVALAGGIGYRFLSKSEIDVSESPEAVADSSKDAIVTSKDAIVASKDAAVASKDAAVSSNGVSVKGILYSEDRPSVLIDGSIATEGDIVAGVKIVKIYKDRVELEKDGVKWTQRAE